MPDALKNGKFVKRSLTRKLKFTKMNTTAMKGKLNKMLTNFNRKSETSVSNELIYSEGKNKEVFEKLMTRFGKSEEELHRMIAALNTSL